MKVSFYRDDCWNWSENLWEGLSLEERLSEKKPYVIAFVGAGGKTSLIRRLAWEGRERGRKVLVVTTTHMFRPAAYGVLTQRAEDAALQLEQKGLAVAGTVSGEEKIAYVGDELYRQICPMADLVLVEADGSRHLPLKAHESHEPVIPRESSHNICVVGVSGFGQAVEAAVHRPSVFCRLTGAQPTDPVTPELAAQGILLEGLAQQILLNQVESGTDWALARRFSHVLHSAGLQVLAGNLRTDTTLRRL